MLDLFGEFNAVVSAFETSGVRYAVIGGLAVTLHGYVRATEDMDFLVRPQDLDKAKAALKPLRFLPMAPPWAFKNSGMTLHRFFKPAEGGAFHVVDVLVPERQKDLDAISRAKRMKWGRGVVKVARVEDVIRLKRGRSSKEDLADIEQLERLRSRKAEQG
jgi:hypothetical protein